MVGCRKLMNEGRALELAMTLPLRRGLAGDGGVALLS